MALRAVVTEITSFLTETIGKFWFIAPQNGYLEVNIMIYRERKKRAFHRGRNHPNIDGLPTTNKTHHLGARGGELKIPFKLSIPCAYEYQGYLTLYLLYKY